MNKLQESVEFIKFDEYKKDKKQNEEKIKILEDNNLKLHDIIAILEKQIDRQEPYPRYTCIFLYDMQKSTCQITYIAAKTICKNINDNITVDDIDRSHRIGKYDPQKQNPRPVILKLARYNVRDSFFFKSVS